MGGLVKLWPCTKCCKVWIIEKRRTSLALLRMEASTAGRLSILLNHEHFMHQLYFICQLPGDVLEFGEDHGHSVLTLFHEDEKDEASRFAWNSGIFTPAGYSPHLIASLKEEIRERNHSGTVLKNKFLLTNYYPPAIVKPVLAKSSKFRKVKLTERKKHKNKATRALAMRVGKLKKKKNLDKKKDAK